MPGNARRLQRWKPVLFKVLDWAQLHSSSPQPTCVRLRQGIAFSNLQTTGTLWYRRQTQVLDWVKYPWASRNNFRLNRTKSKELIFIREKCGQSSQPPPPCPDIERVGCAKVLGITLNARLSATDHVNNLLRRAAVCCTWWQSSVVTASRLSRSTTCFAPPSSPRSRTVSNLHGLVAAQHQTVQNWTHFWTDASALIGFCDNSIPTISLTCLELSAGRSTSAHSRTIRVFQTGSKNRAFLQILACSAH